MLTPSATDRNRKAELKRREREPASFTQGHTIKVPRGFNKGKGLVPNEVGKSVIANERRKEMTRITNVIEVLTPQLTEAEAILKEAIESHKDAIESFNTAVDTDIKKSTTATKKAIDTVKETVEAAKGVIETSKVEHDRIEETIESLTNELEALDKE